MSDKKIFNLLIVDDDAANIEVLLDQLGALYHVTPALSGPRALELVGKLPIDLILLDLAMPDMDGFEVARRLKDDPLHQQIPIIFVTAREDEAAIEKAFSVGGADYITKPFLKAEMLARVRTQIKMLLLIRHLENLSFYDQLSGIYNRRKFFELGQRWFAEADGNLVAVMVDVDDFKKINDTCGHAAGDRVIRAVARTLDKLLPEHAVLGRLGGEEFGILLPVYSGGQLEKLTEGLRQAIATLETELSNGSFIACTISCGVSTPAAKYSNLDALLDAADGALYVAKDEGKNCVRFRC